MQASIPEGRTRETKIRRDAAGRWFNDGVPITHPKVVRAFNGWLNVAEDGRFCLKNEINWAYVEISGAPRFVRRARPNKAEVVLLLSDGTEETLNIETLRQSEAGQLFCTVHEGTLTAAFEARAVDDLAAQVGEDEAGVFLAIGSRKVRPPIEPDPLREPPLDTGGADR